MQKYTGFHGIVFQNPVTNIFCVILCGFLSPPKKPLPKIFIPFRETKIRPLNCNIEHNLLSTALQPNILALITFDCGIQF